MAARLTDKQKKKIIADYIELGSYSGVAKLNGVSDGTVKRIVDGCGEIERKIERKKEENTADILAYMESKRGIVCEIIGRGLEILNTPGKLDEASPSQITTALGTLIDKFIGQGSAPAVSENNLFDAIVRTTQEVIPTDDIPEIEPPPAAGDDVVESAGDS